MSYCNKSRKFATITYVFNHLIDKNLKLFGIEHRLITPYSVSLIDMEIAFHGVVSGKDEVIFFVEHEGIYSSGKSSKCTDFLAFTTLKIYYPGRGGKITVHSPGQIVIYPIINLRKRNINISKFVGILEQWMIDVLEKIGIKSRKSETGIGVWVGESKIGFVGIKIKNGISTHGICLNVSNDLSFFEKIIPCGINNLKVTSIEKLWKHVDIQFVKRVFVDCIPF